MMIRPARSNEKAVLEDVQRRASLAWDEYREALIKNPDAIDLPQQQIDAGQALVCERDNKVGGFAVVLSRDDGDAELDGLFVEPGIWRSGVGRSLLCEAAALAMRRGARKLYVIANPQALAFYQACGFTTIAMTETRFGPALSMVLELSDRSAVF